MAEMVPVVIQPYRHELDGFRQAETLALRAQTYNSPADAGAAILSLIVELRAVLGAMTTSR